MERLEGLTAIARAKSPTLFHTDVQRVRVLRVKAQRTHVRDVWRLGKRPTIATRLLQKGRTFAEAPATVVAMEDPGVRGSDKDLARTIRRRGQRPYLFVVRASRRDIAPAPPAVFGNRQRTLPARAAHLTVMDRSGIDNARRRTILRHAPHRRRIRRNHTRRCATLRIDNDDTLRGSKA